MSLPQERVGEYTTTSYSKEDWPRFKVELTTLLLDSIYLGRFAARAANVSMMGWQRNTYAARTTKHC